MPSRPGEVNDVTQRAWWRRRRDGASLASWTPAARRASPRALGHSRRMDKVEAQKILSKQMERFGRRDYYELQKLVESKHVEAFEVNGATGTRYGVEVQFFWDNGGKSRVRVVGSIDDGGIRAFFPLTQTLLVSCPEQRSRCPL